MIEAHVFVFSVRYVKQKTKERSCYQYLEKQLFIVHGSSHLNVLAIVNALTTSNEYYKYLKVTETIHSCRVSSYCCKSFT